MQIRKILAIFAVVMLLLATMNACGASSDKKSGSSIYDGESVADRAPQEGLSKTEETVQSQTPANQKLIRKVYMNAETEDMDALLSQVEQRIAQLGGYVESREIYNGTSRGSQSRYGDLTIRIPVESLDQFVDGVQEVSNITSLRETTDDVTLSYVATESRIKALQTEEARLLELLAQAENMDDLLTVESRLTEVRTELEQVQSQLRLYDNQVNYGTIYLDITEVEEYTQVEEPESENFFVRIGSGFVKSLKNLWKLLRELVIFLVVNLPYWVVIGLVVFVVRIIRKASKKKENSRNSEKK